MLKHGIQTTSTFHLVVDRLSQDTRNTLADANADAARFVGDVYEDESRAIWRNGPVLGARGLQQQKTTKMMNNRSQKPRVCEGLEHGAYAKDSRIEVGRWKNEELGLREMTFFNFCRFAYRGWAMSQVTTGSPGNLQAKPRPREGNLPYVTPLSPKLLRTQNALRLYSH